MLQFIRERAQGVVAVIIILFLCLTFLLWGIDEYLRAGRTVVVAEVNGEEIDLGAYQKSFQQLRQRAQAELGDQFDSNLWTQDSTKKRALDMLIETKPILPSASTFPSTSSGCIRANSCSATARCLADGVFIPLP